MAPRSPVSARPAMVLLGASALLLAGSFRVFSEEPSKKIAIPSLAEQERAGHLIHELYDKELAKAEKDATARGQLAVTFLQEGKDTTDDLDGRYMLLRAAGLLAARAGDAPTALQAIDDLAQDFALPEARVLGAKIQALTTAGKVAAMAEAHHTMVDAALVLLQDAVAADNYDAALVLAGIADRAALKLKSVPLVSSIRKRRREVLAGQVEYARWKPFAEALKKDPQDAKANLEMGKYLAFVKGNWERGLGLLAQCSDESLQATAKMDLADPRSAAQQAELGAKWLQAADQAGRISKASNAHGKMAVNLLLRAYHWDVQALAALDSEERQRVEKQMAAITERLPPEYRVGEIVEEYRKIEGHGGPVYGVSLSPDGRKAASGGADSGIYLWDITTGKEIRRLDGHAGRVWTVAFAPGGRRLASGGFDANIRLWDLVSGREIRRSPMMHKDYVRSVAFSRDGRHLVSGGDDRIVRLWNVDTGRELHAFAGHDHFVWCVAISPDGKRGLSGSLDKTARLWDLSSGKELQKLVGHNDTVLSVAFSPDGHRALTGSTDKTVKLWDLDTGNVVHTFSGHKGYVNSVAFSPDGRRALSASHDRTLILWDAQTGKLLRRLEGNRLQVWSVGFARDGRLAVSGGEDGSVRVWGGKHRSVVGQR
jgi:WD40 repeat protein